MKWTRRRERDVPANGCCQGTGRKIIRSGLDPGAGGRGTARCAARRKELDNDHAAAAARARRGMIGRGAWIGGVVHCRRFDLCHWSGHQLPGARDVGLAAGARQQPVVADAMKPLWQNVEQKAPDKLVGARASLCDTATAHCGSNPCNGRSRRAHREQGGDCSRWQRDGCSGRDRPVPPPARRRAACCRRTISSA